MPSASLLTVLVGLTLVFITVAFLAALASYGGKQGELTSAAEQLENSIENAITKVATFGARVGVQLRRLLVVVKDWLLSWVKALSTQGAAVLDAFSTSQEWLYRNISSQIEHLQLVSLELASQLQRFTFNVLSQLAVQVGLAAANLFVKPLLAISSAASWIVQKIFCVFVGIGGSIATFFTETLGNVTKAFYDDYIKVYLVDPLVTVVNWVVTGQILTDIEKKLKNLAENLATDVKDTICKAISPIC